MAGKKLAVSDGYRAVGLDSIAAYKLHDDVEDRWTIELILKSGDPMELVFTASELRDEAAKFVDKHMGTTVFEANCAKACANFKAGDDSDYCDHEDEECFSSGMFEFAKEQLKSKEAHHE